MHDAWPALLAAAEDRTSGAAEIARDAAEAIVALPRARLQEALEVLLRGHPSMAPLWRLATEVLSAATAHADAARRFVGLLDADAKAAEVAAEALPASVLTISWSSAVQEAVRLRQPDRVVCMVSDPGGEGERTAEALVDTADTIELIEDAEALERLPAEAVLVGADAVTPTGLINKMGTDALARAAQARGIPVYAVAGETKFVGDVLPVVKPFELVEFGQFTSIATPNGVMTPDAARHHAMTKPVHPDLRPLFEELRSSNTSVIRP